jgi:hypothetical protein
MVHIVSCFWYFITTFYDDSSLTWVNFIGFDNDKYLNYEIYITSLYWAYTTMLTVGYGDIVACNNTEYIYSILWMFLGAGIYT